MHKNLILFPANRVSLWHGNLLPTQWEAAPLVHPLQSAIPATSAFLSLMCLPLGFHGRFHKVISAGGYQSWLSYVIRSRSSRLVTWSQQWVKSSRFYRSLVPWYRQWLKSGRLYRSYHQSLCYKYQILVMSNDVIG